MAELFKVNAPVRKPLFEGVQGENEARSIQFDITPWVEELGDGAVTATAKRSQDSQPYPVTVTKVGNVVTWKPTSTDTAFAGVGSFQLEYTVDDVLAKTCIWSTMVAPSLDPAGDPPDPYDNWLAEMRQVAADALQSEQNAEDSAENAEAWAVGKRGGVDVPSTDPTYENNAKYWAEQSLANQYGAYIVKSASGDIASFADGADDVPMKSLKVAIVPKQAGSGDPSPTNVRPITGWTDADVTVAGENLWEKDNASELLANTMIDGNANKIVYRGDSYCIFIPCKPNTTYTAQKIRYQANTRFYIAWTKEKPNSGVPVFNYISAGNSGTVGELATATTTTGADAKYIVVWASWDVASLWAQEKETIQIEEGSAATAYEPYTGHTTPVPLGQTVYGGEVEPISGEMVIDSVIIDLGSLSWGYTDTYDYPYFWARVFDASRPAGEVSCLCSRYKAETNKTSAYWRTQNWNNCIGFTTNTTYPELRVQDSTITDATAFTTAVTGAQLVYKLETPTTVQLTPAEVRTLLGTNNVWADCGSVAVEYRADPTLAYNELANVIVSLGGNI